MLFAGSKLICNYPLLVWLLACGVTKWTACEASLVQNIRVHVYRPHRNSVLVSALIVWDSSASNSSQTQYAVNAFTAEGLPLLPNNAWERLQYAPPNLWAGPPFPVNGDSNHLSLTLFAPPLQNRLVYPLFEDDAYSVRVSYTTESGETGESESVDFDTYALSPPLEVITTGLDTSSIVGENLTVALENVEHPVTVHTVDRELFHYSLDTHSLRRTTLDTSISKIVANLSNDLIPSALSYDWLGMTLYLAGMNSTDESFGIWKLPLATESLHQIFKKALNGRVYVTMVMNPFTGHLYWTEHSAINDTATLYQLNLRDNAMVSLASPSGDLQLSSALALDSITDRLWVSDQSNGSILSCDISTGTLDCQLEVNTSLMLNSSPRIESISVDELRVYWTSVNNLSLYYVLRDDPSSLMTLSSNSPGYRLLGLSPGQQPWLAAAQCGPGYPCVNSTDACLTPPIGSVTSDPNRPAVQLVNKTNFSISVNWTIPQLLPHCQESVFSYPPLQYTLSVAQTESPLKGFPVVLFQNQYTLTGLKPFTTYKFKVEAINRFTVSYPGVANYGSEKHLTTSEGVPSGKARNIRSFPYGPSSIFITWSGLSENELKGDVNNQLFFVSLGPVMSGKTNKSWVDIPQSLEPSTNYTFNVIVNNGVFNSSASSIQTDSTWPLPPTPQLPSLTNESVISVGIETLMAVIYLSQIPKEIRQLHLELYPEGSPNRNVTSVAVDFDTMENMSNPLLFELNLTNISSIGVFNLQSVASYQPVTIPKLGVTLGPATDMSDTIQLIIADTPDSPRLNMSDQLTLSWTIPNDNGSPVNRFYLLARNPAGIATTVVKEVAGMLTQMAEPLQEFHLDPGEEYVITVVASNAVGNSSESNPVSFTTPRSSATTGSTSTTVTTSPTSAESNLALFVYTPILVMVVAIAILTILIVVLVIVVHRYKKKNSFSKNKIELVNRYANGTTDDKVQFNGTAGESKADHFSSVCQPPKTNCVIANSATCTPAEANAFDSNNSCKIDLQRAEENSYVNQEDFPPAGISQDDK